VYLGGLATGDDALSKHLRAGSRRARRCEPAGCRSWSSAPRS
jgi:hypothetical protein